MPPEKARRTAPAKKPSVSENIAVTCRPGASYPQTDPSVADQADTCEENGQATLRRYPVAFASVFRPDPSRDWWHVTYSCTACSGHHFGMSPTPITTGVRRARCGRLVWLVVARTYPGEAGQ